MSDNEQSWVQKTQGNLDTFTRHEVFSVERAVESSIRIIKHTADPQVRIEALKMLIHSVGINNIPPGLQEEISNLINSSDEQVEREAKQAAFILGIGNEYSLRDQEEKERREKLEKSQYIAASLLDAACEAMPEQVTEETKQKFVTTGCAFFASIIDEQGDYKQEIDTLDSLSNFDVDIKVSKNHVDDLNEFVQGKTPESKQAMDSAECFGNACSKMSKEVRGDPPKSWGDLSKVEKEACNVIEAARQPAGKLVAAVHKVMLLNQFKDSLSQKADKDETAVKMGAMVDALSGEKPTPAFSILENIKHGPERDMSKTSALAKLESLDL